MGQTCWICDGKMQIKNMETIDAQQGMDPGNFVIIGAQYTGECEDCGAVHVGFTDVFTDESWDEDSIDWEFEKMPDDFAKLRAYIDHLYTHINDLEAKLDFKKGVGTVL